LANIENVEVEVYHVFPKDSDVGRTSGPPAFATAQVPTRVNSPSDVEIDDATRPRCLTGHRPRVQGWVSRATRPNDRWAID
jgi:hypothetical protein